MNTNENNNHNIHLDDGAVDFKLIFENIPSSYLILKPDFTIIAVNNSFLLSTKTERSNILNQPLFNVFPNDPNDLETSGVRNLEASLKRVVSKKIPDIMPALKYNIPDPNSKEGIFLERYWQPANYPILDNKGDLIYIIHHSEDITNYMIAQKRASNFELANLELKEVRNFLETILDNIPNMVFVKDAIDLKFIIFNKAGQQLLGYSQAELLGKNDYDFFSKSEADFFTAKDHAVLSSRKILDIPEEPIHTRLHGERILHTLKVPIYDDNGNGLYLVGISEDITDKIQLTEARLAQKVAEDLAKRKTMFLDIAAHELRTPITSLSLMLQLAQRQIEKGKPISFDVLARLKEPADRLSKLIVDLLDMSRLERGLVVLFPERTDIAELVSKCVDDFRIRAPGRSFVLIKPDHSVEIELDKIKINQVLSNILDNAVKYALEGVIKVVIEEKETSVRVSVIDQGPGISENHKKVLFTAFSRGTSDETIKTSGLGLGLSVSNSIIELHGGVMGVEGKDGEGSTFYFELPLRKKTNGK